MTCIKLCTLRSNPIQWLQLEIRTSITLLTGQVTQLHVHVLTTFALLFYPTYNVMSFSSLSYSSSSSFSWNSNCCYLWTCNHWLALLFPAPPCLQVVVTGDSPVIRWRSIGRSLHQQWDRWGLPSGDAGAVHDEVGSRPQLGGGLGGSREDTIFQWVTIIIHSNIQMAIKLTLMADTFVKNL